MERAAALSLLRLTAYGLPGLPLAALLLPLYVYLPAFYAADLGLGFAAVGLILLLARVWDVLTDPLIGTLSDRTRGRFGRRRPWMLAGGPLLLISAYFLFLPAAGAGWPYLLFWVAVLTLGGTMVLLPYSAWGAELTEDYHGRSRVSASREVFVIVGTILAAGLPAAFGEDRGRALEVLFWILLVTLPVALALVLTLVPEPAPKPAAALPWRRSLGLLRSNGPFRRLILAYFLNGIANGLPATLFLLFAEFGLDAKASSGAFLLTYFLCGILSVPLWLRLTRPFDKHRVWIGAMLLACAVFVCVPLLGPGDGNWFFAVCVLTGLALGADLVLPPSMQADVIDLDRLRSGRERAGLYFAIWGMGTKLALALAVGISFPLLELAGFEAVPGGGGNLPLFALAALYSLVPVGFKLASIALMRGYPITAARHDRLRWRISARQASKTGSLA